MKEKLESSRPGSFVQAHYESNSPSSEYVPHGLVAKRLVWCADEYDSSLGSAPS